MWRARVLHQWRKADRCGGRSWPHDARHPWTGPCPHRHRRRAWRAARRCLDHQCHRGRHHLHPRRKRGGHLFSKHRYLSAQMEAYLTDDLWLRLATHANAMGARLAKGIAALPDIPLQRPAPANMLFPEWPAGTHARLDSAGAAYYQMPAPQGREAARLVTSWSTTEADVDAFLNALRA